MNFSCCVYSVDKLSISVILNFSFYVQYLKTTCCVVSHTCKLSIFTHLTSNLISSHLSCSLYYSWDPTRHTTRTDVKAEVIKICERDGKSESRGQLAEERQKRYDLL